VRPSLIDLLQEQSPTIRIVDVGALWVGEEPYRPLLRGGHARVVGFEPISEECEVLNRRFGPSHIYFPHAVADGTRRRFHRCGYAMTSSLYEPDLAVMGLYHNLPHFCQVETVQEIDTVRLDDVPEARGSDFLKLDVQGAELDILQCANEVLKSTLAIQTEVAFVPIYRDQPLFADIDGFLRAQGFMFHRFVNMEGRVLQSVAVQHDNDTERRQLLWSDAVYIRDIPFWDQLPPASLLKLAVIMHELYESVDFSLKLLELHDNKTGSGWRAAYLEALGITPGK
jgi:FkbM family methyltransferase